MGNIDFRSVIDPASRDQLKVYDDGRAWVYVKEECPLTLDQVAEKVEKCRETGDISDLRSLVEQGYIQVERTLDNIQGKDYNCIYFPDCYVIEDYGRKVAKDYELGGELVKDKDIEMEM
jgi:hypothetical protein